MSDLEYAMRRAGGVARATSLQAAGFSRHHLRRAIDRGGVVRVRRNWLALPDADLDLVAAASAGVVLTCITQARRLGLWVLAHPHVHVAADPHAAVPQIDGTVHWARSLLPRHPDALVDPVENVLAVVAACQPFEAALTVWESALRKEFVDLDLLSRLPLRGQARELLAAANPFADSGLESVVLPRLRWLGIRIIPQAWIEGHRVDFLLGDRLVLQIDGGHHVGAQRIADNAHDAVLMLRGFRVIRVGYRQVIDDWPSVQDAIVRAVGQGLHVASA
ncbi:MAG: endonuclease domain-containing protein [Agromyces sp.]